MKTAVAMNGLVLLDKPPGITSARVVETVKWLLPRGTKIGHAGTLDAFASGLLILLVGHATRQSERVMSWAKTYVACIRLDASSPTHDTDSPANPVVNSSAPPTRQDVENALLRFVGAIQQTPPAYSAIKVRGKRASDRLRAGEIIDLAPRTVQIQRIDVIQYEWPQLRVQVVCGRGTYIRALARDLGQALKTGGMLTELRRTRIGDMRVEDAATPNQLTRETIGQRLLPIEDRPIPE